MAHSNAARSRRNSKVRHQKPRTDFPLFPHRCGYWAKKVRQKLVYFGKVDSDPKGEKALVTWLEQKDDLLAGRTPREKQGGLTVEDLADLFLSAKQPLVVSGELSSRSYQDYHATGQRLIDEFGSRRIVEDLRPDDFEKLRAKIAKKWGPARLATEVQRIRTMFKYGFEAGHMDKPMRFGPAFKKPSKKVLRKHRAAKGSRMLEVADCRTLLDQAGLQLKAMILLALNGGLGNSDIGNLPISAIDLERGWVSYPRPKTGIERRFPLWPETVAALKAALAKRPQPKEAGAKGLVFITKYGGSWAKAIADSPVSKEFRKLLDELKLHRPGIGFYSLRHVFETIAGESRDQVAVDYIMGHARDDMASVYRERISDERLIEVVDHVHEWLYPRPVVLPEGGAK